MLNTLKLFFSSVLIGWKSCKNNLYGIKTNKYPTSIIAKLCKKRKEDQLRIEHFETTVNLLSNEVDRLKHLD